MELFCLNFVTTSLVGLVIIILLQYIKTRFRGQLPPGPMGYPLIGCVTCMRSGQQAQNLEEIRKQYGDIYCQPVLHKWLIFLNGKDIIRDAYITNGNLFSDRPDMFIFSALKYKDIVGSSGEYWKQIRKFSQNSLRDFGFGKRSLEGKILDEVEYYLTAFETNGGNDIDVKERTFLSVSNVICSLVFGDRFDYEEKEFLEVVNKIKDAGDTDIFNGPLAYLPIYVHRLLAFFGGADFEGTIQTIKNFTEGQIKKHKKDFNENELRDFTDAFIKKLEEEKESEKGFFNSESMTYILLNLFAAGTGTTSVAIRWGILHLLHNPEVQQKCREEIQGVIGSGRRPSLKDEKNMPYTVALTSEILRTGSIAPVGVPHGSSEGFTYKGYYFPPGCVIIANLSSVNYDPDMFPNPMKFDPGRFLDESGKLNGKEKEIIPFSVGKRTCLGEPLARMELFLFVTSIVQRFELRPMPNRKLPPAEYREPNEPLDYYFQAKPIHH